MQMETGRKVEEKNKQANKTAGLPCPLKDLVLASVLYRGHCSLTNAGRQMLRQTLNLRGIQALKGGPKISLGSIQGIHEFGQHCLYPGAPSCSFQYLCAITFLWAHYTYDHTSFSSSTFFIPSIYLTLNKFAKINYLLKNHALSAFVLDTLLHFSQKKKKSVQL